MELVKELGDIMWYVASMSQTLGVPLERVAIMNIEKLKARYPDGFSAQKSLFRSE